MEGRVAGAVVAISRRYVVAGINLPVSARVHVMASV